MTDGKSIKRDRIFAVIFLVLLFIAIPVSASFVFQNVAISPVPPVTPGQKADINAQLVIIPQGGPTTFIESNQIQLSTQLTGAQWDVQVMVNGVPAAKIPVTGNVVFINGFLLSYPTSSDVSVIVNVTGMVPAAGSGEINLVQAVQLNNAGQTIPGSTVTISGTVAASQASGQTPAAPRAVSPAPTITRPAGPTTRASGFSAPGIILGIAFCALVMRKIR